MTISAHTKLKLPDERDVEIAAQGRRALAPCLSSKGKIRRVQVFDEGNQAHQMELPTLALHLLDEILAGLAKGSALTVVPVRAALTTQEAADLLNVSRPHLVKLLESGKLPFHRTGKHRRVMFVDLMQFRSARDRSSEQAMNDLSREAQELDMGYE